jgi:hypothetical protein
LEVGAFAFPPRPGIGWLQAAEVLSVCATRTMWSAARRPHQPFVRSLPSAEWSSQSLLDSASIDRNSGGGADVHEAACPKRWCKVRVHQVTSKGIQRAGDVPCPRCGAEQLLRMVAAPTSPQQWKGEKSKSSSSACLSLMVCHCRLTDGLLTHENLADTSPWRHDHGLTRRARRCGSPRHQPPSSCPLRRPVPRVRSEPGAGRVAKVPRNIRKLDPSPITQANGRHDTFRHLDAINLLDWITACPPQSSHDQCVIRELDALHERLDNTAETDEGGRERQANRDPVPAPLPIRDDGTRGEQQRGAGHEDANGGSSRKYGATFVQGG